MTDEPALADVIAIHPPVHAPPLPVRDVSTYPGNWPTIDRLGGVAKRELAQRMLREAWLTVDCVVIAEETGSQWPASRTGVVCVAETPELAAAIADTHNRDGGHV
jgi:hypothetical protein